MPKFGAKSTSALATCVPPLQVLAQVVVVRFDCAVIWGRRGKAEQEYALQQGWTTKHWPHSSHNVEAPGLSAAMDLTPYPVDWNDQPRLYYFSGYVRGIAERLGIKLRYGADWDGDYDINDQMLRDPCYFEHACAAGVCQCPQRISDIKRQDQQSDRGGATV